MLGGKRAWLEKGSGGHSWGGGQSLAEVGARSSPRLHPGVLSKYAGVNDTQVQTFGETTTSKVVPATNLWAGTSPCTFMGNKWTNDREHYGAIKNKQNMEQMGRLTNAECGEERQPGEGREKYHQNLGIQTNYLNGSSNL